MFRVIPATRTAGLVLLLLSSVCQAKTITVTQDGDQSSNGVTLRYAIEHLANPGDEIDFDKRVNKVKLRNPLVIPESLSNLTVRGKHKNKPTLQPERNLNTPLFIHGDQVTIQGLAFADVQIAPTRFLPPESGCRQLTDQIICSISELMLRTSLANY